MDAHYDGVGDSSYFSSSAAAHPGKLSRRAVETNRTIALAQYFLNPEDRAFLKEAIRYPHSSREEPGHSGNHSPSKSPRGEGTDSDKHENSTNNTGTNTNTNPNPQMHSGRKDAPLKSSAAGKDTDTGESSGKSALSKAGKMLITDRVPWQGVQPLESFRKDAKMAYKQSLKKEDIPLISAYDTLERLTSDYPRMTPRQVQYTY